MIELSFKAGCLEINEELIHINRKDGPTDGDRDRCKREIEANEILIKNAKKWNFSKQEIEEAQALLRRYTKLLKDLEGQE